MARIEQERRNDVVLTQDGVRVHLNRLPKHFDEPKNTIAEIANEFNMTIQEITMQLLAGQIFFTHSEEATPKEK